MDGLQVQLLAPHELTAPADQRPVLSYKIELEEGTVNRHLTEQGSSIEILSRR